MNSFLVATGTVVFKQMAESPLAAIEAVKARIIQRDTEYSAGVKVSDPTIGASLVEALKAGKLQFLVMDAERNTIFAGELDGVYQEPISQELAKHFARLLNQQQLNAYHIKAADV